MASAPVKLIGLLRRRPDLTLDQYSQHWRTVHRELSLRLIAPGIRRAYQQNHRIDADIEGLDPVCDGAPELWTSGPEALTQLGTAPEYLEGAYLDEPNFMDGRSQALLATEQVLEPGPGRAVATTLVKAMVFVRRAPGVSMADFAAWAARPGSFLFRDKPARLTRHLAIDIAALGVAGEAFKGMQSYDGIEASYWPDLETFRAAWRNRSDGAAGGLVDTASIGVLPCREEPVLWPQE